MLTEQDIEIIKAIVNYAVNRALEEAGCRKKIITRAEFIKLYGKGMFEHSKKYINWQKKGSGKTSTVYAAREEVDALFLQINHPFIQKINKKLKSHEHRNCFN